MLNSVGLQGPGLEAWLERDLPALTAAGARVVVSIWGQSVDDYGRAAAMLAQAARGGGSAIVAVEVNVSCPNVEDRSRMFAHSETATARSLAATECGLPRWAKLSPNVPDIAAIAGAALGRGADGLTLTNTLLGLALDLETGRPVLGAGGGGLSGAVLHPVAVRAVWECRAAFPDPPSSASGGWRRVGTRSSSCWPAPTPCRWERPSFRDPRAPWKVLRELGRWCAKKGTTVAALRASARAGRTAATSEQATERRRRRSDEATQ